MRTIRPATLEDLDLLLLVEARDEGVEPGYQDGWTHAEVEDHRRRVEAFILDADKGALVAEEDGERAGALMWRARDLRAEALPPDYVFFQIGADAFPDSGTFLDIFQLWVSPAFRRKGIATALKLTVEDVARTRGLCMVYTHTEERNLHVLDMNRKLGYREVRRGPIWDDVVRVSLVKRL